MEVSSPLHNLAHTNLSNNLNDKSCPENGRNSQQSTNELIANLDHELWDVRLRALKCILGKVECSIVTTDSLSRRIDLLHRLSDWLRAIVEAGEETATSPRGRGWSVNTDVAVKGIPYVLKLLFWLTEFDNVRQFIAEDKLDTVLSKFNLYDGETKILLGKLFDRMCTNSFEFQLEGSPDAWNDNASCQSWRKNASTEKSCAYEDKNDDDVVGEKCTQFTRIEARFPDTIMSNNSAGGDSYFPNQSLQSVLSKSWTTGFNFSIPSIYLAGSDRRVLASTVESLLTKNENLVFTTCCFLRDVLLQDFPPEVFIQESALCMAIFEVAESPWNDLKVANAATKALLSLSNSLRIRMVQLNSSEFYETKHQPIIPNQYSGISSYSSHVRNSTPTTDSFAATICQLLKGLSRTLLFHPKEFHLWKLLDTFSLTICKCAHTFPLDYKNLSLGLQEVLLDLAYCYEKHNEVVCSPVLALCCSSILKALQINQEDFILAYDVRQCIRKLSRCPRLRNGWPEVYQYFWQIASPLVDSLNPSGDADNVSKGIDEFLSPEDRSPNTEYHPQEDISKLLLAIQNATGHETVIKSIDDLWVLVLPLAINSRLNEGVMDYIYRDVSWRDSFYRFLCVEPTCTEDEDLLIQVADLMSYIFANMNSGRSKLEEWIVPLCMENGCALLKLLSSQCLKPETSCSGTMLPRILRSLLDFYFTVMKKTSDSSYSEFKWNMFNTLCMIFHQFGDRGYSHPAVLLPVLKGIATFSTTTAIKAQLLQNSKFCIALIHRISESIIFLQERSGGLSDESYRNQGVLYYSSLSLYHMVNYVSGRENLPSSEWIGTCCALIPCMWDSMDARVRALGYQISGVLSCKVQGVVALMSILETPSTIWINCYHSLMNVEEAAVVKQHATATLCNLIGVWDEVERFTQIGNTLQLPNWLVLDDVAKLLAHVFWLPKLSEVFKTVDVLQNDDDSSHVQIVTPKALTMICKMLLKMQNTSIPQFHPQPFVATVCGSGICPILFRLVGTHGLSPQLETSWCIDSCYALSSVVEALIAFCQLDRGISLILIADKQSLISLIQLLAFKEEFDKTNLPEELVSTLCVNVFTLLTVLCSDSGNNFEDFERCISNQRKTIFTRLTDWLRPNSLAKCRKIALNFSHELLSRLTLKQQDQESEQSGEKEPIQSGHPILCREWNKNTTYGSCLCLNLMLVYEESTILEEKLEALQTLCALCNLSPSAKMFAIEHDIIGMLVEKLKEFGKKYYDVVDTIQIGRKINHHWMVETISILSFLSSLVYKNLSGKKSALRHDVVDTCHKIFKFWKSYPDRTMLHAFVETLLNFTEEFPAGCQALTLSSSILGVGPRKAPAPQCFLFEILDILQTELNLGEACNLKSVELLFEFLKNATFVVECRNILLKSPVFQFLTTFHVREIKKWSPKQQRVKLLYLEFLWHISVHPDMQTAIAKIPDAIDILVSLIDVGDNFASLIALKLLRNLSFQAANRTRLLCDDAVLRSLSAKIRDSENFEEIECAAVGLWALIANSEKGKLSAKKCLCPGNVAKAVARFRKIEQSSNDILTKKQDLSTLINILNALSNVLGVPSSQSTQSLNE